MRTRLGVVAVATTTMVALAFLVPLAVLVRSVARDRALTAAERDAEALAPVLAVTADPAAVAVAVDSTTAGREGRLTVFLAGGGRVGAAAPVDERLELARRGSAFFAGGPEGSGGRIFLLPVLGSGGTSVVRVFVPESRLRHGVMRSWAILGGLALLLVGAALVVADRLAASVVRPVRHLSEAAHRLAAGDLATRLEPGGPEEVAAVARAFNLLAGRVGELLEAERELVADLSHRLRTPLTVLRLQAEAVPDPQVRERLREATDDLERAVTQVIEEARRPIRAGLGSPTDLCAVVRERAAFWGALAEEQGRAWHADLGEGPCPVAGPAGDLAEALDALLGNVFAHTPEGTAFSVRVSPGAAPSPAGGAARWSVVVEDAGPGFPEDAVVERGRSGGGSTGLGLDIARRTAEAAGGTLRLGAGASGGARVELTLPAA